MKTLRVNDLLIAEGDSMVIGQYEADVNGVHIELICKGSELTEEIAQQFMRIKTKDGFYADFSRYVENAGYMIRLKSALESFQSLIESKGFYWGVNPISEKAPNFNDCGLNVHDYLELKESYHEAESKTFNLNQTLIFKIVE